MVLSINKYYIITSIKPTYELQSNLDNYLYYIMIFILCNCNSVYSYWIQQIIAIAPTKILKQLMYFM